MPNILRILVVEPNRESRTSLHVRGSRYGLVESFANFESARERVMAGGFDYLITNIQLEAFNGLHLVYLSRSLGVAATALAYTDVPNDSLAADAHAAGAAYCAFEHVLRALADDLIGNAEMETPASVTPPTPTFSGARSLRFGSAASGAS